MRKLGLVLLWNVGTLRLVKKTKCARNIKLIIYYCGCFFVVVFFLSVIKDQVGVNFKAKFSFLPELVFIVVFIFVSLTVFCEIIVMLVYFDSLCYGVFYSLSQLN